MNAYVNVVPHPFFAVTKDDGSFEIKGLPAGSYTLELWHERLGTQTLPVTVDAAAPAKVTASFKPASSARQRIIPRALLITRKGVAMKIVNAVTLGLCTVIAAACGGAETPPASTASAPAAAPASPRHRVFFVSPTNGATIKPMSTIEFGSSGVTVAAVPPGELKPEQVRAGTIHYHIAVDYRLPGGRHRDPEGRPVGPLWRRQESDRDVAGTGGASSHRAGGR